MFRLLGKNCKQTMITTAAMVDLLQLCSTYSQPLKQRDLTLIYQGCLASDCGLHDIHKTYL